VKPRPSPVTGGRSPLAGAVGAAPFPAPGQNAEAGALPRSSRRAGDLGRVLCLTARRCDDCGDEVLSMGPLPVCPPCVRLATLRQRLARQPGAVAIRRAADK